MSRTIDALVAEHVMGRKVKRIRDPDPDWPRDYAFVDDCGYPMKIIGLDPPDNISWVPRYSTDISAAWEMVEKFKWCEIEKGVDGFYSCKWSNHSETTRRSITRGTAPMAICLAALKAKGVEVAE
jgi:hypothetical protein